ncbi:MAG: PDZ domain-containing protein, partial [Acidimicrobiia bacterium]
TGGWTPDPTGTVHAGMIATNTQLADEARGGALVDRDGKVVGILAVSGAATPVDMAAEVATQLVERGWASHGSLGIRATDAAAGGATVVEVAPGSSAERAGLQVDDRIVAIDGTRTADSAAVVYALRRRPAGRRVKLTVVRGKRTSELAATLDDAPASSVPWSSAPGTTATSVNQPVLQPTGASTP